MMRSRPAVGASNRRRLFGLMCLALSAWLVFGTLVSQSPNLHSSSDLVVGRSNWVARVLDAIDRWFPWLNPGVTTHG
jgi:hypothetical protein